MKAETFGLRKKSYFYVKLAGAPARFLKRCKFSSGLSWKNEGSADLMKLRRFSLLSDESSHLRSFDTREKQSARGADAHPHLRGMSSMLQLVTCIYSQKSPATVARLCWWYFCFSARMMNKATPLAAQNQLIMRCIADCARG